MKHLFLDTNVLLDFLTDRKPFADQAATLFQKSGDGAVKLYVAAISFNNIYYIIRQVQSHDQAIGLIKELESLVAIIAVDADVIKKSLEAEFRDFEDAIQYFAAASVPEVEAIVTRNAKDFKNSSLPVLTPEAALMLLS